MNKNLVIVSGVFFLMLMIGIVYAATENESNSKIAYGQCVSQNAVIKNSCYATVKETRATCKSLVPQDEGKKDALKLCRQTYKADKKQCKVVFKTAKGTCKSVRDASKALE